MGQIIAGSRRAEKSPNESSPGSPRRRGKGSRGRTVKRSFAPEESLAAKDRIVYSFEAMRPDGRKQPSTRGEVHDDYEWQRLRCFSTEAKVSGELWGGIIAFVILSGGLFAIWKDVSRRVDDLASNHLKHTDDRITRVDERLKEAKSELRADIHASEGRLKADIQASERTLKADIQASEGRLHAAIENLRRTSGES